MFNQKKISLLTELVNCLDNLFTTRINTLHDRVKSLEGRLLGLEERHNETVKENRDRRFELGERLAALECRSADINGAQFDELSERFTLLGERLTRLTLESASQEETLRNLRKNIDRKDGSTDGVLGQAREDLDLLAARLNLVFSDRPAARTLAPKTGCPEQD